MKRFHVHMHVADLPKNIAFYSALFNAQPARSELDYAKWMLNDPPLNFAISTRGSSTGVDHMGIQVDNSSELVALRAQAQSADLALLDEGVANCCYAKSDKYWLTDPQGVAWEQFHTLASIPVFGEGAASAPATATVAQTAPAKAADCCAPRAVPAGKPIGIPVAASKSACC